MSEFKEHLDIVSRTNKYHHKKCGGEGIVTVEVITEIPKLFLEQNNGNKLAMAALQRELPITVRMISCKKCSHKEVGPVT